MSDRFSFPGILTSTVGGTLAGPQQEFYEAKQPKLNHYVYLTSHQIILGKLSERSTSHHDMVILQTDRFIEYLLESILNLEMFDSVVIVDTISDLLTLVKDHFHLEMKRCSILSLLLNDHRLHEFCLPSALIAACVNIYTMRVLTGKTHYEKTRTVSGDILADSQFTINVINFISCSLAAVIPVPDN